MTPETTSKRRRVHKPAETDISFADRLAFGILKPVETWTLAGKSRTVFYNDVRAGKVKLRKIGERASGVFGPDAQEYVKASLGELIAPAQSSDCKSEAA